MESILLLVLFSALVIVGVCTVAVTLYEAFKSKKDTLPKDEGQK